MFEHRQEERHTIYCTLQSPKNFSDIDELTWWDGNAARMIKDAESLIKTLTEYRGLLAQRAQELLTMDYERVLILKRETRGYNPTHKFYRVEILHRLADGTTTTEQSEVYPGPERHKAFKRFAELQKLNPGIITEQDTAKGKWEK